MTQAEAERLIIPEMRKRLSMVPYTAADAGIRHFFELQKDRPDLFNFRCSGDKWQVVHGWMLKHGLVTR